MGLISRVSSRTYRFKKMSGGHHAIPIKVLHEAEGHIITVETLTGEIYRGKLQDAEDNMNIQITNVTMTSRNGSTEQLQKIYIRVSQIRFMILPDMLKNAPMLATVKEDQQRMGGRVRGGPAGRGFRGGRGRGEHQNNR